MAKPSTLWPVEAVPPRDEARVETTQTNQPPMPGHPDTLKPSKERLDAQDDRHADAQETNAAQSRSVGTQEEMLSGDVPSDASVPNGRSRHRDGSCAEFVSEEGDIDRWEPKPPKVLMDDPNSKPLELHSQIQLYATNE
jgi:hypothetical protein